MLVALTKFLTFFKSGKIINFSHLNSANFKDNFTDNFLREKANKMASKAKTLNICALWSNWKWIYDDLIWSRKNWFPQCNSKFQSTLVLLILSFASFAFLHHLYVWECSQVAFWWLLSHRFRLPHYFVTQPLNWIIGTVHKNSTSC